MKGIRVLMVFFFIVFPNFLHLAPAFSLTVEEVLKLKKAGVSEETIRFLGELEAKVQASSPDRSVGMKEIVLPDGGRRFIYYSVTPPELEKETPVYQIPPLWQIELTP